MDKKRLLLSIGLLTVTGLIGFLLFQVFFASQKPSERVTKQPTTNEPSSQFPTIGEGQGGGQLTTGPGTLPDIGTIPDTGTPTGENQSNTKQVVSDLILGVTADPSGGAKFYNQQDGKFYHVLADGTLSPLNDQTFFNVDKVTWSPKSNESIIEYPDGANIYYNFDTRKQVTLPKHWESFSFTGQGNQIAAKSIGFSPENHWLIAADPTGTNISLIEPLGENKDKVIVDWSPNNQVVAFSFTGEPLGADRQEVLFIGLHGENFKSAIVEGRGFVPEWSPTGEKLLYSVYNGENKFKPELWIVNAEGDTIGSGRRRLEVETWANKCAFGDTRYIYCGVPTQLPTGAGLAPEIASSVPDNLYRIDTQTGFKIQIPLDETHTVDNLFIGKDGKTIYFTDKQKAGLFSVPIQ